MGRRIRRESDNLFAIPKGANVTKTNAVYVNVGNYRIEPGDGRKPYTSHKKLCIGVVYLNSDGTSSGMMYGNDNYYQHFQVEMLPEPPERADSISVGPRLLTEVISEEYSLVNNLVDVFGTADASLILDLAMYMLTEEKAIFQHYPAWGRRHELYSSTARSDSYISRFLGKSITYSKIMKFRDQWARDNIGNGRVYYCYDSTNTNSQAEGVFIVQKGHAKDDPTLMQVNTDYVVRQEDGLPLTFMEFPGSIVDIAEASEMIKELNRVSCDVDVDITLICDRGYISEENVLLMDDAGIGFLLMLKTNMGVHGEILDLYSSKVKNNYACYLREYDEFGMTIERPLFDSEKNRWFHLLWNQTLEGKHRKRLLTAIENKRKELEKAVDRKTKYSEDNLKSIAKWFTLCVEESGEIIVKKKGRGGNKKTEKSFIITAFKENSRMISNDLERCGFYLLVSSQKMDILEARNAYAKRDCVEKVFQALKSSLGMDEIGVASDDNIQGKSLIWFVASILHSILFNRTKPLRVKDKKSYTVPAIMDKIEAIVADKNLSTGRYVRRYKLDKKQNEIFKACGISVSRLDEMIREME